MNFKSTQFSSNGKESQPKNGPDPKLITDLRAFVLRSFDGETDYNVRCEILLADYEALDESIKKASQFIENLKTRIT